MNQDHIRFLVPFLYDGEYLVQRSPGSNASDLTRKAHHVFDIMREDPTLLKTRDVAEVVYDANSQLVDKDGRMAHYQRVAGINHQLVTTLLERNPHLGLPSPEIARSMGLVHDLSNAFARYHGKFNQEDKELTLYHLAVELNVPIVANAAQHAAYLEIADMIAKRKGFATVQHYSEWSDVYNEQHNPHNVVAMFSEYGNPHAAEGNDYVHGKDKLSLMVLTVADFLDDGKSNQVGLKKLKENFYLRMSTIVTRDYYDRIKAGKLPTAFGVALLEKGGLQRMEAYLNTIESLLSSSL